MFIPMTCTNKINDTTHPCGAKPLECTECLEYNNRCRLLIEPWPQSDGSYDVTTVQRIAASRITIHLADASFETISAYLAHLQAQAAATSLLRDQAIIKQRVPNPKAIGPSEEWIKSVKAQQHKQRPKAERKQLSQFDKAVADLVKLNISLEDAKEIIAAQFAKQGKVTK